MMDQDGEMARRARRTETLAHNVEQLSTGKWPAKESNIQTSSTAVFVLQHGRIQLDIAV